MKRWSRNYRVLTGEGGQKILAVDRGGWEPRYAQLLETRRLAGLAFSSTSSDVAFLDALPEDLRILRLSLNDPSSLGALERFTQLEELSLDLATRRILPLEFDVFGGLRVLRIDWNGGFGSLFARVRPQLSELYVARQPHESLAPYAKFVGVTHLRFGSGSALRTTEGLASEVETLEISGQRKLERLEFGRGLALTSLEIEGCPALQRLDGIEALTGLQRLLVNNSGAIESLEPLAALTELRMFTAWESTNVLDGDLEVLCTLPNLQTVALASRGHYRPSVAAVHAAVASHAR